VAQKQQTCGQQEYFILSFTYMWYSCLYLIADETCKQIQPGFCVSLRYSKKKIIANETIGLDYEIPEVVVTKCVKEKVKKLINKVHSSM
jgi:hypothetical protein